MISIASVDPVTALRPIEVPHTGDAWICVDRQGRRWVRKLRDRIGDAGMLGEALGALIGDLLGASIPEVATCGAGDEHGWLSSLVLAQGWDPDAAGTISNLDGLAAGLVTDMILHNEDRNQGGLLLVPNGDGWSNTAWIIDFDKATAGSPHAFTETGTRPPDVQHHLRGLPIDALAEHVMESASRARKVSDGDLLGAASAACNLVGSQQADDLFDTLWYRCQGAEAMAEEYLEALRGLS